jgi:16S rRNA (adenine1518-N6/adenine1519-N6)-dimethyltransferase
MAETMQRSTAGARPNLPLAGGARPGDGVPTAGPRADQPAALLRSRGLRARKGLSQSFLTNAKIAAAIVRAAKLDPAHDDVLEVGPGLGILTERLVKQARQVVALELDEQLAEVLGERLAAPNLTIEQGDVLRYDPAAHFAAPYVVVANLPYHVTTAALRHLLQAGPPVPSRLVVMVQLEVAERIAALQGELSSLAVFIQTQASVELRLRVPRAAFFPRPNVDSAVLVLRPHADEALLVPRGDVERFGTFVQAGFTQPRKQLANSLAQGLAIEKGEATALLERAGIAPSSRPQQLAIADWVTLWRAHAHTGERP